jgi:tetratricopeptide (TPR) repeat protein
MKSIPYFFLLALLTLGLTNCKTIEAYQQAQTAFSQGATVEMRERFADAAAQVPDNFVYFDDLYQSRTPIDETLTAADYYTQALENINKALSAEKPLKKVMALDNAYAIKALTQWRRGELDDARATAEQAISLLETNEGEENDLRDLAMMRALPGLINMDESYQALLLVQEWGTALTSAATPEEKSTLYGQIRDKYKEAVTSEEDGTMSIARGLALIDRAIEQMDGESAIELYLRNAELAGMDNWGDMLQVLFLSARRVNESPEDIIWVKEERSNYEAKVQNYLTKLETALPNGKENKLYKYWTRLLTGNI